MRYLVRDGRGTYYFRRPIPQDLRQHMPTPFTGKANWKRTMETKDAKQAKKVYTWFLSSCNRDFQLAELRRDGGARTELADDEIALLAEWFHDLALVEDDEFRTSAFSEDQELRAAAKTRLRKLDPSIGEETIAPHRLSPRQMRERREGLEFVLRGATDALAAADTSWIWAEVDEALLAFGIKLDKAGPSYRKLCLAFLAALKTSNSALLKRLDGEVVPSPPSLTIPSGDGRLPRKSGGAGGPTIEDAHKHWAKVQSPRPRSAEASAQAVRYFTELNGNVPVSSIRRSDAVAFRDAVRKLPVMRYRRGPLFNAPVPKLLKWAERNPDAEALSPATVNKLVGCLAAIVQVLHDDGKVPDGDNWTNPFRIKKLASKSEKRLNYDADDLRAIFTSAIYTKERLRPRAGKGEAAFWLPLLGLFHGSRVEELAQLLASDVKCEEGIWFYRVLSDDGTDEEITKRTKVTGKRLTIPLHEEIIRLGFLDYCAKRREAGPKARLFGDLRPDSKERFSASWSKWWGHWAREKLGITDKRKVFHSFRHGWKDAARRAGVSEELSDAITGHEGGGGTGRRYGRGSEAFPLRVLKEQAMEKIAFPGLDLSGIQSSQPSKR